MNSKGKKVVNIYNTQEEVVKIIKTFLPSAKGDLA